MDPPQRCGKKEKAKTDGGDGLDVRLENGLHFILTISLALLQPGPQGQLRVDLPRA